MSAERQRILAEAAAAARRGDFAAAAESYRKLLTSYPRDLLVRQRFGDALARAGRAEEARAVFEALAESYREAGHPQRALAALRRAVNLSPDDPELRERLAARLLERGLKREARAALEEAVAAAHRAGDSQAALRSRREVVRLFPEDREALAALAEEAEAAGEPLAAWGARWRLAAAHAAAGELDAALEALKTALRSIPAAATCDGEVADAVGALVSAGCESLPAEAGEEGEGGSAAAGWRLLRAEFALALGRRKAAEEILEGDLSAEEPALHLWSARLFAALGREVDAAAALSKGAELARAGGTSETYRTAAAAIIQRFPGIEAALPPGSSLRAVPAGAPDRGPSARLPEEIEARLVEAATMLEHGLVEPAAEVLGSLPGDWGRKGAHPRIDALRRRVAAAAGVAVEPATPRGAEPPRGQPGTVGPARPSPPAPDDDDVVVLIEDEGESADEPVPEAATRTQPIPVPEIEPAETGSVDRLAIYLGEELPSGPEHAETRYQMAIGLLEMGLEGQAAELLAGCLDGGPRHWDAALELVRGQLRKGRSGRALETARRALETGPADANPARVEILVTATRLALEAGKKAEAERHLAELTRTAPEHPGLEILRSLCEAS
ncbi:MAG: tetratricopeptide repeat protein [Acidobacteria bacterium]|nr:MAG: tetratricopeptide repeat protein [Acidobacteriota bacterium]